MTRDQVAALLIAAGERPDRATLYADAFIEYQQAAANIREFGAIVKHPRSGNPVENPYLRVRDRAGKTLARMNIKGAADLWREYEHGQTGAGSSADGA